jgi:hypothetical protein
MIFFHARLIYIKAIARNVIMQKLLVILLCIIYTTPACAEVCPAVDSLKSGKVKSWKAYDSDNNKPLSPAREARLRNEISHFSMAEFSQKNNKSVIHCYYNNNNGSNLEAYFAKENILAIKPSKYWYQVTGLTQCAASAERCEFQALPEMQQQLASNENIDR